MKKDPLVSILMPAFNVSPFVEKAIESVLQQTYTNFELLIADDGSTDDTIKKIEKYSDARIRFFKNPANIGYLQTANFLFKECKGDLITFQDSDDWCYPGRIGMQVEQFVADDDLGLCAVKSRTEITVDGLYVDSASVATDAEIRKYENETRALPFTCATIMITRKVFDTVGGYRLYFDRIGAEHVDWAYMIYEKFKCANVNTVLYYYRFNKDSFTKSNAVPNVRKRYSLELARFFFDQRRQSGTDDLVSGDLERTNSFLKGLEKKYSDDKSLWSRETATTLLNQRLYNEALKEVRTALGKDFWNVKNIRLLFWILARVSYRSVVRLF